MKSKIIKIVTSVFFISFGILFGIIAAANSAGAKTMSFNGETQEQSSVIIIDGEEIKAIDNYNSKEVLGISLGKIITLNAFEVYTTGASNASTLGITAKVNIKNHRVIKDKEAFIECISYSNMSIGTAGSQRFLSNGKVVLRKAETSDVKEDATAEFKNDDVEIIDDSTYKERYGWLPYQMNGYIFNDNTYLEYPTMIKNDDDTYTILVKLDPNSDAAFYYKREVATNANTTYEPVFKAIQFEIKIDSSFVIHEVKTHEEYQVTVDMGFLGKISSDTTTECVDTYNYDNVSFDEKLYNFYKSKLEQQ